MIAHSARGSRDMPAGPAVARSGDLAAALGCRAMPRANGLLGVALQTVALLAAALLIALLALPPLALVLRVPPAGLAARFAEPAVVEALRLSFATSASSTLLAMALGLPLAHLLVSRRFRGRRLVETLVDLPMVLPPTVAGAGLLFA